MLYSPIAVGTKDLLYLVVLIFLCRILPLDLLLLKKLRGEDGLSPLGFNLFYSN